MSVEGRSQPGPESDEGDLALFGFEGEGWVALMREASRPEELGSVAGYRVLDEVGRGGQGVVFRAREETSGRVVALKRLAAGSLAGAEARARFQREIEAEASLRHPNIVGYQGVELVEGQPLLVMEWIDGLPAARWAREAEGVGAAVSARPVREVLAAFTRTCDAVAYAHQRGVIHRDLKPSNILIDSAGEPHLLDFGLARWRPGAETFGPEQSRLTRTEGFVGTPAFAAPEQLTPGSDGADVRTDVYALGVVLYEMLTGRRPFETGEGDWERLLRAIREETPPPPSRHDRRVDGEVDAIVLRAMAKDPVRRYQSAHELSADVRRYLAGEPVEARRDSAWYVGRKFLRRHRVVAAASALVVLSLAAGMVGTTLGLMRAEQRRAEAEVAERREREQRKLAEVREKQTQQVSDFQAAMLSQINVEAMGRGIKDRFREQVRAALGRQLVGEAPERRARTPEEIDAELAAFDNLADAAQAVDVARGVMDEFVLARAADALETGFADQPLVQAQLREAIGDTYHNLGAYDAAEPHLRAALEIRSRELGSEHVLVADSLSGLGVLLLDKGDYAAAEPVLLEALAMRRTLLGDEHPAVAAAMHNLAGLLAATKDFAEAEPLYRGALAMRRKLLGDGHPDVVWTLENLGNLLTDKGDYAAAEPLLREALARARTLWGDQHPDTTNTLSALAKLLDYKGDYAAEPMFRDALAIARRAYGDEHPYVAASLSNLAGALSTQGDFATAEPLIREALAIRRKVFGDEHPEVEFNLRMLAAALERQGKWAAAEPVCRELLELARKRPTDTVTLAAALARLGLNLIRQNSFAEAEPLLRECLAIREGALRPDSTDYWLLANTRSVLGGALAGQGAAMIESDAPAAISKFTEAEPLLVESGRWLTQNADRISQGIPAERLRQALERIVGLYESWDSAAPDSGKDERAAEWRAELETLTGP